MTSRAGLYDWIIQRLSALYLTCYLIVMTVSVLVIPARYQLWQQFFATFWVQLANVIMVLSLVAHAWVGLWTIITDYVKPPYLRAFCKVLGLVLLLSYFIAGIGIFWR